MATEAPTAAPPARLGTARALPASSRGQTALACLVYVALSLAIFGSSALPHLGSQCVCGQFGNDPGTYMWFLAWWPHALLHGHNPFLTDAVFAPDRLNIGAVTLVPGAALIAAPLTLLFGPLVSFNVLALASPALAALFAFLLCRYVSGSFVGALVGGYIFGFSAYMLGHMLGHLNLVLTFPIPAGVLLFLRQLDGTITTRRFIALMALDLVALVTFSTELAVTAMLIGAVVVALALVFLPRSRMRLRGAIPPTVGAGLIAAVVTSPFIYYAFKGNVAGAFSTAGDVWSGDLLGFVIPTHVTGLGGGTFTTLASKFNENDLAESGIYLGLPLILITVRYASSRWRLPITRLLSAALLVVFVLALGSHLHVGGHSSVPLPWDALAGLPLLKQALPVRLGLYVYLLVAVIAAIWIANPREGFSAIVKWELVALSIAFIFPNVGSGLWNNRPSNPRLFTTTHYRRYLRPGEVALTLPWAGFGGYGMLWQAETGMWFRLAGGNLGKLLPADYRQDPILSAFMHPELTNVAAELHSFLLRRHVGAVIVDASQPQQWPDVLGRLGLTPVRTGGVLLYRLPRS